MQYLANFLIRIFNLFNFNMADYQNEVDLASANTPGGAYSFNSKLPPYFYSGRLLVKEGEDYGLNLDLKMIFLTMNPQENPQVVNWAPGTVSLHEFIERQNNWFISAEANQRRPSNVYGNCQVFLSKYFDLPAPSERYELLHKYAVALDWFPFYSPNFSLINQNWNGIPEEYMKNILSLFGNAGNKLLFIAIGAAARNALSKIGHATVLSANVTKVEVQGKTVYCVPRLAAPGVGRGEQFLSEVKCTIQQDMVS